MNDEKDIQRLSDIIVKALQGKLTEEEEKSFSAWLDQSDKHRELFQRVRDEKYIKEEYLHYLRIDLEKAWLMAVRRKRRLRVLRIARYAAACVAVLCVVGAAFLLKPAGEQPSTVVAERLVTPGSAKALLIIGEEEKIVLDDKHGLNLRDSSGMFMETDSALLRYQTEGKEPKPQEIAYHTLLTERGGEYRIVLSDGTEVIVNSESRLRYPSRFAEGERVVYLEGEAYFDVAEDKERPFRVITDAMALRVYGTEFNVNTRGERVQTVLVEGSVGVRGKNSAKEYKMKPSDLAEFSAAGELLGIRQVNVEKYVSWKDGLLIFEDETLEEIMEALALWYDVDVFFQNPELKHLRFGGYLRKYENIDIILEAIHRIVGVNFSMNGKTVIVQE